MLPAHTLRAKALRALAGVLLLGAAAATAAENSEPSAHGRWTPDRGRTWFLSAAELVWRDGRPAHPPELDTYAPRVDWNHRTVLASGLPDGEQTVTITATGRSRPESSNAYVQVVGFETTGVP